MNFLFKIFTIFTNKSVTLARRVFVEDFKVFKMMEEGQAHLPKEAKAQAKESV